MRAPAANAPFVLADEAIAPGTRRTVNLPVATLATHTPMDLPIRVVHGRRPGPALLLSAALHGDEINGVEVIRRVLRLPALNRLRGTLVAAPIVNLHGFLGLSRYLPDRRDLNRSFPGSPGGSLAAQLAALFLEQVVRTCTHGIDLHTAAIHRDNLPQIRVDLGDGSAAAMARAFGAPVILNAAQRPGSLRQAAGAAGVPMIVYEAGEALRYSETCVRGGVTGVVRVMHHLGMLGGRPPAGRPQVMIADRSRWVRAPASGVMRARHGLGKWVEAETLLAVVADPLGEREDLVAAPQAGLIIGRTNLPVVNQGDGLFHLALLRDADAAVDAVETFQSDMEEETTGGGAPIV